MALEVANFRTRDENPLEERPQGLELDPGFMLMTLWHGWDVTAARKKDSPPDWYMKEHYGNVEAQLLGLRQSLDLEKMLGDISVDPAKARRLHGESVQDICKHLQVESWVEFDRKTVTVQNVIYSIDSQCSLGYGLALLLDIRRAFGESLRRCRLDTCKRFFLAEPGDKGGPRPQYCCPEHREKASGIDAKFRVARYREKQRRLDVSKATPQRAKKGGRP